MQEHALPQDVTGYKFHIIGNMTLKQFGEVGAGCIIGFLLYQTNLPFIIKIPLIIISAGAGAMVAFVPLEERPLDQWIGAFFRALYRPTQYYWKRVPKIPEPFLYEPRTELRSVVADVDLTPARRQRVKDYLRSIDEQAAIPDQFDEYTDQRLGEVMTQFGAQLQPALAYANGDVGVVSPEIDESAALLNASPDSVSEAVDNLSFVGRAASEEPMVESGPTAEEAQMSNDILNLFENPEPAPVQPEPDIIPPLPAPVLPTPPVPKPDVIPEAVTISIPEPKPTPPPEPPKLPEPPKPEPVVEKKVVESSFTSTEAPKPKVAPPAPTPPPAPARPEPVPEDLSSIPDVSLEPEKETPPPPAELPQISTVFDSPSAAAATAESIPKVDTYDKYSLSAHAADADADSSQVAAIADVIEQNANGPRSPRRAKNSVQFKTNRTNNSDKYETVLPHILDMTGASESVSVAPKAAPPAPKPLAETKEVIVPELEDIKVEHTQEPEETKDASKENTGEMSTAVDPSTLEVTERQNNITVTSAVKFNADLPFPDKPTKPNKVVGMVIDQAGNSQAGAIVEILSPEGIPARAVKTNPLGQFFIATPLNPGEYLITAEKDGFTFPTQQLSVINKLIDPIEIRAN